MALAGHYPWGEGMRRGRRRNNEARHEPNEYRANNARRPGEGSARRASLLVYSGLQGAFRFLTLAHLVGNRQRKT